MEPIDVITAVHHPLRRRIFDVLLLHGATQVGMLAKRLDAQVGSISHHLRMLERAGVVERADDPNGDKRTSWWRLARLGFTWSTSDFEDSPADALLAREAERQTIRQQFERLQRYRRRRDDPALEEYTAVNTEYLSWATPDELADLAEQIKTVMERWRASIDPTDGHTRVPVFAFAHVFPTEV
jgi:DNA-binding transcriptional ArsR family regulator